VSGAITLEGGGAGELSRVDGEVLHAVLDRPLAPGTPVRLRVEAEDGAVIPIQGKTVRSQKREDGHFDVRMRLINLRREHRDRLRLISERPG
jgi:hypothetical protein